MLSLYTPLIRMYNGFNNVLTLLMVWLVILRWLSMLELDVPTKMLPTIVPPPQMQKSCQLWRHQRANILKAISLVFRTISLPSPPNATCHNHGMSS